MGALFDADGDQITYGDVTTFDSFTALTVSCWARLDSVANAAVGRRWISKWGTTLADAAILVGQGDGAGTAWTAAVSGGGNYSVGTKTATLATGSVWIQYSVTWTATATWGLFQNNTDLGPSVTGTGTSNVTAGSTVAFTLGMSGASANSILGALAEVAVWNRVLTADERNAISVARHSPNFIPRGLVFYAPLIANTISTVGPQPTGSTGITFTDHPPVIRRSYRSVAAPQAAAAAPSATTQRRTFSELGTRTGTRQVQEA